MRIFGMKIVLLRSYQMVIGKFLYESLMERADQLDEAMKLLRKMGNCLDSTEYEMKYYKNLAIQRSKVNNPFSEADIKRLISLCHPDKHGNSKMSVEITQKLLTIRGQ